MSRTNPCTHLVTVGPTTVSCDEGRTLVSDGCLGASPQHTSTLLTESQDSTDKTRSYTVEYGPGRTQQCASKYIVGANVCITLAFFL